MRTEGDVKTAICQQTAGLGRFFPAFGCEGHVHPAGETVLGIPDGFAMPNQNQACLHWNSPFGGVGARRGSL
jgi:hypothetical protein